MRAVYWMQDEMESIGGPWLPQGRTEQKAGLGPALSLLILRPIRRPAAGAGDRSLPRRVSREARTHRSQRRMDAVRVEQHGAVESYSPSLARERTNAFAT